MPPTPIIGIDPLDFSDIYLITSFDLSEIGLPLNPPDSFIFLDFRLFLCIVVLVAIIPSIFKERTISTISERLFFDKSGDILRSIGFGFCFFIFSSFRDLISLLKALYFATLLNLVC